MPTKKLIEVALPLEAINVASAREKSIRHGHPSTLHLWWARRPLAACRAVLFASLVDDPSSHPEQFPTDADQQRERERLFRIIEELVQWENSNNERVLSAARAEIMHSTGGNLPPIYDPFAGGGSIPLEAQRLGLEAHASDLNPVAVLINKALIEIPPKFANMPPVNPIDRNRIGAEWKGAAGLAADVRYYGKWMRDEAEKRIGHLYPKVNLPKEHGGGEATVIAWLWARTVKCPNPACGARMPLVRSFALSTKKGKEAWVEPIIEDDDDRGYAERSAASQRDTTPSNAPHCHAERSEASRRMSATDGEMVRSAHHDNGSQRAARRIRFEVRSGNGQPQEGTVNRRGARCVVCGTVTPLDYVRAEGKAGRMGAHMTAIVAEGRGTRLFLSAATEHQAIAEQISPAWKPEERVTSPSHDVDRLPMYGMFTWGDAFSSRQLVVLTTLVQLQNEAKDKVRFDMATLQRDLCYVDAVVTFLGIGVSRLTSFHCTLGIWSSSDNKTGRAFGRQALSMVWDYPEANPFAEAGGEIFGTFKSLSDLIENASINSKGFAKQADAGNRPLEVTACISTDPPYYDNVGYADLSDFFYVWLRPMMKSVYPDLFSTLLTPKSQELVASSHRFDGNRSKAEKFFEHGLGKSFAHMRIAQHTNYPLTVFYAFKQAESDSNNDDRESSGDSIAARPKLQSAQHSVASTGWETMLEALISAGFAVNGTWPVRTEQSKALKDTVNALASSIVLVCRPRSEDERNTTRLEFIRALRRELPEALRHLQKGNIAPVDLAQAAIGPGMAIFSRHRAVLEADGTPMRVRTALQLINQALDEVLAEQEGEYDTDTRWAIAWFDQFGVDAGPYDTAETLSKAKNTSVGGMVEAGIAVARAGKVRLLKRDELPKEWNPAGDKRLTAWETVQHLVHALDKRGEQGAAELLARIPGDLADVARDLAYRLYATCERKKWAQEALAYNALVVAWPEIARLATEREKAGPVQTGFDLSL